MTLSILLLACPLLAGSVPRDPATREDPGATLAPDMPADSLPGELIVKWSQSTGRAAALEELQRRECRLLEEVPSLRLLRVSFDRGLDVLSFGRELSRHPALERAEPNSLGRAGFIPSDTYYSDEWHHRNTGQTGGTAGADVRTEEAWEITRGSESIVVAVLDSGIDSNHFEFQGRIVPGYDSIGEDFDPEDDFFHGTLVAGILAANADNDFAVAGVDHRCKIMPVKVVDSTGIGTNFDLVQGLDFATANADTVKIVSMSLINYSGTAALMEALDAARDAGLILIACAGNGGTGNSVHSWPGASHLTISVGLTDHDDQLHPWSATGARVDVVAPGAGVPTVVFDTALDLRTTFTGCSAATPVVAGIASLLLSLDPHLGHFAVRTHLRNNAVDQVGDPAQDTPGWDPYHGHGRVDALATLLVCGIERYCSPASPNQTGQPARLEYLGTTSILENDGLFAVSPLDPPQTGLIAYSPDQASMPLGNGTLCLGSSTLGFVVRLPGTAPVGGVMTTRLDHNLPPVPLGQITSGSTWNFQSWNRDFTPGGSGFNFSDALSIHFCP